MNLWERITNRLFNWGGRFLKTDLHYLAKGGGWLGVGQLVATGSTFLLSIAFANLMSKNDYGIYKYILSIVGLLAVVTMPGVNTFMATAIARGAEGTFLFGMKLRMKWGLLAALGGGAVAIYYFIADNTLLASAFAVAAVTAPFMDTLGLYSVYLQSKKLFKESIRYYSMVQIAMTAILAATLFIVPQVLALIVVYFIGYTVFRLFFLLRTLRQYAPNETVDRDVVRYGRHLSVVNILGIVVLQIDSVVLFQLIGAAAVAVYAFALGPSEQIRSLFKNIAPLSLPKRAQRSFKEINAVLVERMLLLAGVGTVVALLYTLAAPLIFALVFPAYLDAVIFSQALAWLLAFSVPAMFLASAIQAKIASLPTNWLYWAAAPDIAHIASLVVFVPIFGIWGVIIAKALDVFIGLIISIIQWMLLSRGVLEGRYPDHVSVQ